MLIGKTSWPIPLAILVVAGWAAVVTPGWVTVASCILGWTLLALAVIDLKHFILPDLLTLPLLLAGLVAAYFMDVDLIGHVIGAAAGYGAFATMKFAYRRLRGREGLGLGDAKLLAALGTWVSWQGLPTVVFGAAALGLIAAVVRSAVDGRGTAHDRRLPFGPFLAAAGWLVWLYGPLALA